MANAPQRRPWVHAAGTRTSSVGTKFFADGTFRRFPGSSVICFLWPDQPQWSELVRMQQQSRTWAFADRLAYLPPSSFHMTVFDLVCDQRRLPVHWSARVPLDIPLEQMDALLKQWLEAVEPPPALRMRAAGLGDIQDGLHLLLRPADPQTGQALGAYREAVSAATGIRHPSHEIYPFHVTLAYLLHHLDAKERQAFARFAAAEDERLARTFGVLELGPPELVLFEDMSAFGPSRAALSGAVLLCR